MRPFSLCPVILFGILAVTGPLAHGNSISEFNRADNEKLGWRIVDDGVMGGLSRGNVAFSRSKTMRFFGDLSLKNNGGFSSVRTRDVALDLSEFEGLVMRVKGDGRTYQLRLNTDARYRSWDVSFQAAFETKRGKWTEVRVPFSKFVGGFRGRMLRKEVLEPGKIRRLGILLGDKKPGAFKLEVDWVRAYKVGSKQQ